jgi:hypothetical protein
MVTSCIKPWAPRFFLDREKISNIYFFQINDVEHASALLSIRLSAQNVACRQEQQLGHHRHDDVRAKRAARFHSVSRQDLGASCTEFV